MKTWNEVVRGQGGGHVTDHDTALVCRTVLQKTHANIPEKVWTAHLMNLWEERQLGRDDMLILMREYHEQQAALAALPNHRKNHNSQEKNENETDNDSDDDDGDGTDDDDVKE